MTTPPASTSLASRVDVLDHAVAELKVSLREHAHRTEDQLSKLATAFQTFMDRSREAPRPWPVKEMAATAAATCAVLGFIASGLSAWMHSSIAPDRQRIEQLYEENRDVSVLRYRIQELEKRVLKEQAALN